jgi:ABC-2 type transport system permease protein
MKLQRLTSFARLFINLLKKDLLVYFRSIYIGDLIDNIIWAGTFIFIMTYVLPQIGLAATYGAFFAVSMIITVAFWDTWNTTTKFIADLEGTRTIEYYLTLPLPASLYFIEQLCYFAIRAGALSLGITPLAKIILWNQFDLSQIAPLSTIIIFVNSLFFCATMSLIMASMVKDINNLGHVGIRTLFPMFSTGGTQYSWFTMYALSPMLAYISLANPLLYATEGMHAAMLGQPGYLPLLLCIMMVILFAAVFGMWSIRRMKRRLDCV